jgi:hypothetical protein
MNSNFLDTLKSCSEGTFCLHYNGYSNIQPYHDDSNHITAFIILLGEQSLNDLHSRQCLSRALLTVSSALVLRFLQSVSNV